MVRGSVMPAPPTSARRPHTTQRLRPPSSAAMIAAGKVLAASSTAHCSPPSRRKTSTASSPATPSRTPPPRRCISASDSNWWARSARLAENSASTGTLHGWSVPFCSPKHLPILLQNEIVRHAGDVITDHPRGRVLLQLLTVAGRQLRGVPQPMREHLADDPLRFFFVALQLRAVIKMPVQEFLGLLSLGFRLRSE